MTQHHHSTLQGTGIPWFKTTLPQSRLGNWGHFGTFEQNKSYLIVDDFARENPKILICLSYPPGLAQSTKNFRVNILQKRKNNATSK